MCYLFCCIRDSFEFDMPNDHVLKELIFDLLTHHKGPGRGGVGGGCGQNICYHSAA